MLAYALMRNHALEYICVGVNMQAYVCRHEIRFPDLEGNRLSPCVGKPTVLEAAVLSCLKPPHAGLRLKTKHIAGNPEFIGILTLEDMHHGSQDIFISSGNNPSHVHRLFTSAKAKRFDVSIHIECGDRFYQFHESMIP